MKSNSQLGQEDWVLDVLKNKRNGFFLDSGAADGVYLSNTLKLEKEFGWTGICVEPLPSLYNDLVKVRGCVCLNIGLDVEERDAMLRDHHVISRIDPNGTIPIKCLTVRQVLDEHKAPPVIDYWSLDTENNELELLETFPWDKHQIRVLTVEHNCNVSEEDEPGLADRWDRRRKIFDLLIDKGFEWAGSVVCDDFYINKSLI
jgi:hypothetical protein